MSLRILNPFLLYPNPNLLYPYPNPTEKVESVSILYIFDRKKNDNHKRDTWTLSLLFTQSIPHMHVAFFGNLLLINWDPWNHVANVTCIHQYLYLVFWVNKYTLINSVSNETMGSGAWLVLVLVLVLVSTMSYISLESVLRLPSSSETYIQRRYCTAWGWRWRRTTLGHGTAYRGDAWVSWSGTLEESGTWGTARLSPNFPQTSWRACCHWSET